TWPVSSPARHPCRPRAAVPARGHLLPQPPPPAPAAGLPPPHALPGGRHLRRIAHRRIGPQRQRAHDLRPVDGNSLPPALHLAPCRRGPTLMRSAGLATTLEVCGQAPEAPAGVQLTVYRLGQGALTNTLKHGRARDPPPLAPAC